jgi:hypothetical protein
MWERTQWQRWLALAKKALDEKAKNWGRWSKLLATRLAYIVLLTAHKRGD